MTKEARAQLDADLDRVSRRVQARPRDHDVCCLFWIRRAKLDLKSGEILLGVIVSTNFGTDLSDGQAELQGEAALSAGRMFGELHVLPDVGRVMVVQAIEVEASSRPRCFR